jgi:phosphoribosylamine--glycine ligase/phosphoribosylformylglycinamidine cyclo-ligase
MPALFQLVRDVAFHMPTEELYRTLNMGIGMVIVCAPGDAEAVQRLVDEPTWRIGKLVAADESSPDGRKVHLQ